MAWPLRTFRFLIASVLLLRVTVMVLNAASGIWIFRYVLAVFITTPS